MKVLSGEKILIGPSTFSEADKAPIERLREAGGEVIGNPYKRKFTKSELIDLLAGGATGLIAGLETLDKEALEGSRLKVISRCGTGMSNIDMETAKRLGIKVLSTPDAPTASVAELTVASLLGMIRMLPQMDRDMHEGRWVKRTGVQLENKTVLIIGFGRIGRKVASLLRPFRARIIASDPGLEENAEGIEIYPLAQALAEADIITIHSSGERLIIGPEEFKLMKHGVFLLNSSRGDMVDEKALVLALEEGRVKAAWLDVFRDEPYKGPLTQYAQVILTPHVGSYTAECRKLMEMQSVDNLIRAFLEGKAA